MPTRIENIILRARDTLADPNAERYSDERLLRLLSEGQQDIVKQTKLLRNTCELVLIPNVVEYSLPEDVWIVTRATFEGSKVDFITFDEMDEKLFTNSNWQTDTGNKPLALVYDRLNIQRIQVYPIPTDLTVTNNSVFTGGDTSFYGGFELGVATDITDYSFNSIYGVVTNIYDPFITTKFNSNFGVLTNLFETKAIINIQYFALAADVLTVNDTLVISPLLDVALKHYIISQALRDDLDTQSRTIASEAFKFYERELALGKKTAIINSTANVARATEYTGPFQ